MKLPGLGAGSFSIDNFLEHRRERRFLKEEQERVSQAEREVAQHRLKAMHEAIWNEWEPRLLERARQILEEIDDE